MCRKASRLITLSIDSGIKPTPHDKEMVDILRAEGLNFIVLANKIDRLNQSERAQSLRALEEAYNAPVLSYSARTHTSRQDLLDFIAESRA